MYLLSYIRGDFVYCPVLLVRFRVLFCFDLNWKSIKGIRPNRGSKQYPEWVKEQVRERIAAGETQKQLSKELGISRYSIQSWCGLRPETKLWQLAPMPKGRPKKNKTIEDYEKENKRLRMEVALMRDFLQSVERM